ncbi:DUF3379 family protein [Thalassotalea ponticola]|uniref:DUF3379 family protein n=1 Tax=Thalassotalea ponticola TaxID=1523392 RepID=UPI0025B4DE1A|nr:DUF3379 family protein [Thalassotalea ponticola]MDN3651651.1 DUF3379 family protein [Thalassotalea ponticola]
MDEISIRKRLYADPVGVDNEVQQAIEAKPNIGQLARELNALNGDITKALHIDTPDNLAQRIILQQRLTNHRKQRQSRWYLALAASVVAIIGLSTSYVLLHHQYRTVADYAIAHVLHDGQDLIDHAKQHGKAYPLADINRLSKAVGVSFHTNALVDAKLELVAAEECFFDGMNSIHLVFSGIYADVTVLIIGPSDHLKQTAQFNYRHSKGVSRQYDNGRVIIFAHQNEPLDKWQQVIDKHIEWLI